MGKRGVVVVALAWGMSIAAVGARAEETGPFAGLKFRALGPAAGGRVSRVAGVAGDPLVYYAATAQGGVWKSDDGGIHWHSIFDDQPVASIGSIAVAASDPNVVYVGSGEANIRGNVIPGEGIFRSTDAGKTWTQVWKQVGQIGQMAIDPRSSEIAFAAVLGHAFGPNPERGVYRTTDGGATWKRVLFKDDQTGASAVAIDPNNPRIVFAGLWQARRQPWVMTSGGPGSGLYRSADGGETWKQLTGNGLPEGVWGKVGVAVAPSDSHRIYALIEAAEGGLFRSDDGGENWRLMTGHHALRQRAWYYTVLTVDPTDADVVWFPQVPLLRTIDGGKSVQLVDGGWHHGDLHDAWIDPRNPKRIIVANDGGVDLSFDGGKTFFAPRLPIAQFYNLDADQREPFHVGGTMQDEGTASGPTDSLRGEGIVLSDWRIAGGGEAGDFVYDPVEPGVSYAGEYSGIITVDDEKSSQTRNVSVYPTNASGHGGEDLRVRFQWTAPIATSPHDPQELYHGANVLFRSRDRGRSWTAISPDLTRNDKEKQKWSGGPITGDNTGVEIYDTIFSVALSPLAKGEIWAGTDDGLVHVTRDDGATWQKVTPPGAPEWATVECIEPSRWAAGTAYVVIDAHRLDDNRPYLYRTADFGKTWTSLAGSLPATAYLIVLREDAKRSDLLYLGTQKGLMVSRDAGKSWQALGGDFPTVAVTDLAPHGDSLAIATSGRSLWILDDVTPLRDWSAAVAKEPLHLYPAPATRRWAIGATWGGEAAADNPPYGVAFYYSLAEKAKGEATLEILESSGRTVRKLSSVPEKPEYPEDDPDEGGKPPEAALSTAAGLHRAVWDLRWEGAHKLERAKVDTGDPRQGPVALPGRYTLRLSVDGHAATSTVEVLPDPRSTVPAADLEAQLAMALRVRDEIERVSAAIVKVRAVKAQAADLADRLAGHAEAQDLAARARAIASHCDALEAKLHNPKAEVGYDILAQRGGTQLYSNLIFVFGNLTYYGDGAPTQGEREVEAELAKQLGAYESEIDQLVTTDLPEIDRLATQLNLGRILLPE